MHVRLIKVSAPHNDTSQSDPSHAPPIAASFPAAEPNNHVQLEPYSSRNVDTAATSSLASMASECESRQQSPHFAASDGLEHDPMQTHSSMPAPELEPDGDLPRAFANEEPEQTFAAPVASMDTDNGLVESSSGYRFQDVSLGSLHPSPIDPDLRSGSRVVSQPDSLSTLLATSDPSPAEPNYGTSARHVHTVLPAHVAPTCPLDQILIGFFNSHRDMLSKGAPLDNVIGPPRASVKILIHPERATSVPLVSKVMSEVMSTYPYVGKPEQLALFYLMHQTMRVSFWMIFYV
jgi:hypothetical protein